MVVGKLVQGLGPTDMLSMEERCNQQPEKRHRPAHGMVFSLKSNINITYNNYTSTNEVELSMNQALLIFRALLISSASCKANCPKISRL